MRRKIIFIGDSHTHAIKRALLNSNNLNWKKSIAVYRYAGLKNGKKIGDLSVEEMVKQFSRLKKHDIILSVTGGNQYNILGLIQHPQPFQVLTESNTSTQKGIEIVPYQLFFDTLLNTLKRKDFKRVQTIREATRAKFFHIGTPAPKRDNEHILRKPETDFVKGGIADYGVSDAKLRLSLWEVQTNATSQLCQELGVQFISFPGFAIDGNKFLKKEYYARDATHVNGAYGRELLNRLYNYFLSSNETSLEAILNE